ncbi:hypothetical protein V6N13_090361 [Hibiscus sabdariffa]|uniref:TPX2 C-terminal domain-containing protein n=1 Tax=Hibiscus sabdariffa TaxID=183260 RepID=A0ABR2C0P3_9ROSI
MGSSNPTPEVSVSFGRFANDSLSWEKWSSFSPNKYVEEVEKCATSGSVAEKKAYFEEYYKKIAARKAELLAAQAQEKPMEMETKCFSSDDLDPKSIGQCSVERDQQESDLASEVNGHVIHYNDPEITRYGETENSSVEGVCQELNKQEETAANEAVSIKHEDLKDFTKESRNKNVKVGHLGKSQKITPMDKDRNERVVKKKLASPVTKTPQFSTPRASKPKSAPTTLSASRTPSKTGSTLSNSSPKTKNPVVDSKKMAPRSLHMSLSLGPPGSSFTSLAATRKSLIMEKMGDKDIVKRTFKTFQNNYNQLKPSGQEQSPTTKPVPAKGRESRSSTLRTLQKNDGGSSRVNGMEKKNAKAPPSYVDLKSDERAERRKELSKKSEEKSNGKDAERKCHQTKPKIGTKSDIHISWVNHQ